MYLRCQSSRFAAIDTSSPTMKNTRNTHSIQSGAPRSEYSRNDRPITTARPWITRIAAVIGRHAVGERSAPRAGEPAWRPGLVAERQRGSPAHRHVQHEAVVVARQH